MLPGSSGDPPSSSAGLELLRHSYSWLLAMLSWMGPPFQSLLKAMRSLMIHTCNSSWLVQKLLWRYMVFLLSCNCLPRVIVWAILGSSKTSVLFSSRMQVVRWILLVSSTLGALCIVSWKSEGAQILQGEKQILSCGLCGRRWSREAWSIGSASQSVATAMVPSWQPICWQQTQRTCLPVA